MQVSILKWFGEISLPQSITSADCVTVRPPIMLSWCRSTWNVHLCSGSHTPMLGVFCECMACVRWGTPSSTWAGHHRLLWQMKVSQSAEKKTTHKLIWSTTPLMWWCLHKFLRSYITILWLFKKGVSFKVWHQEEVQLIFISNVFPLKPAGSCLKLTFIGCGLVPEFSQKVHDSSLIKNFIH